MTPEAFTAWRKSRYSSQAAAAEALGLSSRAIFAYEKGETPVPLVVTLAIETLDRKAQKRKLTARARSA